MIFLMYCKNFVNATSTPNQHNNKSEKKIIFAKKGKTSIKLPVIVLLDYNPSYSRDRDGKNHILRISWVC
jgi:hypothetical protein